jgi:hypothetical protein
MLQSCNIGDKGSDLPPKPDPIHKLGIGQETGHTSGKVCEIYQRSVLQLSKLSASYAKPMFFSARVRLCQVSTRFSGLQTKPINRSARLIEGGDIYKRQNSRIVKIKSLTLASLLFAQAIE